MALVLTGGGIIQISGSIGGTTFAKNRFGKYMRAKTKPINPRSARQCGARIAIMFLAEQWREDPMDDDKRDAWETYANSVNWQNKLGESVKLTGFNMFIRANAALLRLGGAIVTDGPTDLGLPPGDPDFDVIPVAATNAFHVIFGEDLDWCDEDAGYLTIEVGEPQNPTRNFFGGPWRWSGSIKGDSGSPPVGSKTIDSPFTLTAGQKVWTRAAIIREDGRMSTKFECEPNVVPA